MIAIREKKKKNTVLSNEKKNFMKDSPHEHQIPAIQVAIKYFDILEDFMNQTNCISDDESDVNYKNINSCLNIIYKSLDKDSNFHGIKYFQILIALYSYVPDKQSKIKCSILSIIDFIVSHSSDALDDFIRSNTNSFLIQILQNCTNSAIRNQIFYIMNNIMTRDAKDPINQICINDNYIEIFFNEYNTLLASVNLEKDMETNSLMFPVISGIIKFIMFPELIQNDVFSKIFEKVTEFFTKSDQYTFYAIQVEDVLANVSLILEKINLSMLIESGFIAHIYQILNDNVPFSIFVSSSFYFLGKLSLLNSPISNEIIANFNFIEVCIKIMNRNLKDEEYFEGFFYYITNVLYSQQNSIIKSLYDINFFDWCIAINKELTFQSQKSLCYCLLSVMYYAELNILSKIISNNNLIDFIFEVLSASKKKIIVHALTSFVRIFNLIPDFSTKYPYFFTEIVNFSENPDQYNECDDFNELFEVLKRNIGEYIDN